MKIYEFLKSQHSAYLGLPLSKKLSYGFGSVIGLYTTVVGLGMLKFRYKQSKYKFNKYTKNKDAIDNKDLTGKLAIITGSNSGIGRETLRVMVRQGCTCVMACRNKGKAEKVAKEIIDSEKVQDNQIILMTLDLSSLQSVKQFSEEFLKKGLNLDYLINNAGIMALPNYRTTVDGFEKQFGVNHLGHFYLVNQLLPLLKKSKTRIVNLSSSGHRFTSCHKQLENIFDDCIKEKTFMSNKTAKKYNEWYNYGISKTSNILFSRQLNDLYWESGIVSVAVHPGAVQTDLSRNMSLLSVIGFMFYLIFNPNFFLQAAKTLDEGAACSLRCVSLSDEEIIPGEFYVDCQPSVVHGKMFGAAKEDLLRNRIIQKKLWKLSKILVEEKGFTLN